MPPETHPWHASHTTSPFDSVRALTATIAAELGETAQGSEHYGALFALGIFVKVWQGGTCAVTTTQLAGYVLQIIQNVSLEVIMNRVKLLLGDLQTLHF